MMTVVTPSRLTIKTSRVSEAVRKALRKVGGSEIIMRTLPYVSCRTLRQNHEDDDYDDEDDDEDDDD
eukprot:3930626-Karenia_brevis.AAC.1